MLYDPVQGGVINPKHPTRAQNNISKGFKTMCKIIIHYHIEIN